MHGCYMCSCMSEHARSLAGLQCTQVICVLHAITSKPNGGKKGPLETIKFHFCHCAERKNKPTEGVWSLWRIRANAQWTVSTYREPHVFWHCAGHEGLAILEKPIVQKTRLGEDGDRHGHEQEGSPLPLGRGCQGNLLKEGNTCAEL